MDFLKNNQRISFQYGPRSFHELEKEVTVKEGPDTVTTEYRLPDGLMIINQAKKYEKYGAYEWVTYFKNTGVSDSGLISRLFDCDAGVPFECDKRPESMAFIPGPNVTKIFSPKGSVWTHDEFSADAEEVLPGGGKAHYLFPGDEKFYASTGGRSSQGKAPFFDINRMDSGVIFAIGWTGQWNCKIFRDDTLVHIQTGIEDVGFKLHPGEKIRTSSIVLLPYSSGQTEAHNQWRRLLKEHFSLIGREGRPTEGPFCNTFWGAVPSDKLADRIHKIGDSCLGYEYTWIDAGWYGTSVLPCPNEFEGDWPLYTGDWRINTTYHPDKLQDVTAAIKENNMKFVLWFEPERVKDTTPVVQEHPEYFLHRQDRQSEDGNCLLDLGSESAWQYCFHTLSEKIEELNIGCYRQDFNFDPLYYWRDNDEEDRRGILEIKHINGMYRLWDALLEKFPHLLIDNCASGGRRIDIETLRRSIPLWRSDYQCPANFDVETTQTHTLGFNMWLPYSGTGTGRLVGDTYRIRSSYGAAMCSNYWYTEAEDFEIYNKETLRWIRKTNAEYLKARPFFSCDFYPLTEVSVDDGAWCAYQFDRPEGSDGIVMAFKRPKSSAITYKFALGGVSEASVYTFTDADTGESFKQTGEKLLTAGFCVTLHEKRTSKLYFYSVRKK